MARTTSMPAGCASSCGRMARGVARGSPASTPSARSVVAGKQLSRNHQPLDLAGAFANGGELDVAEVLFRGIVLHEAVAAEDLDAVLGHADRDLAGIQLRHRRLER